jgi:hypothetical protein
LVVILVKKPVNALILTVGAAAVLACWLAFGVEASENGDLAIAGLITPAGAGTLFETSMTAEGYIEAANALESSFGYINLAFCNTEENNLNIRAIAAEDGRLLGKLPRDAACEVHFVQGEWSYISSGSVEGFVKSEYLLEGFAAYRKAQEMATLVAEVEADTLKVREEPNTECEVITWVPQGELLEVDEVLDSGWVKIFLDADTAYVSGDYVKVKYDLPTAVTMSELLYGQGISDIRVDICEYAKRFLGNRYVYGGTSLTNGIDCSAFVMKVYARYGISIPRTSVQQANIGTRINAGSLKPGDLIFYARGGTIDHVALYIGGGQVIHASSPRTGIRISRYNYRTPYRMVRVIQYD